MTLFGSKKTIIQKIVFFVVLPCFYLSSISAITLDQQLEAKGGVALGEKNYGNGKYENSELVGTLDYLGKMRFLPWLSLLVKEKYDLIFTPGHEEIDGVTAASISPYSEKNIPVSNDALIGIQLEKMGLFEVKYRNFTFFDARGLYPQEIYAVPAIFQNDVDMGMTILKRKRYMNNFGQIFFDVPIGKFSITSNNIYKQAKYGLESYGYSYVSNDYDSLAGSLIETESDLWNSFYAGYGFYAGVDLSLGAFTKTSLSNKSHYNFYIYNLTGAGSHSFPGRKNKLTWWVNGEWYEGEYMKERGYATGLHGEFAVRDVWTIIPHLFLKGYVNWRFAKHNMFKKRYEASIRKSFRSQSSIESGYFSNRGGLFPTQGVYLRSVLVPVKPLRCSLTSKAVWEGPSAKIDSTAFINLTPTPFP